MKTTPYKLYIVISSKLKRGLKIAQACHALRQFSEQHPVLDAHWHQESNNIVCLQTDDIRGLADELENHGLRLSRFHEPDLDNELTAFAAEPKAWKRLSSLKLAS